MSCADACIDMDYDDDNEFYVETTPTARKPHVCCECGQTIQPGQPYERVTGKSDGAVWTVKSCAICREIRKALVCGSWQFGELWESIREGVFPAWEQLSPLDCLAKIDSLDARDKLRTEYAEWREDAR